MTFALVCSFYQDIKSLKRQLESAAGNFEYCFYADGRYKYLKDSDYFFENPLSVDGSRELIECYKNHNVYLIDKPDISESEKRMALIDVAKQYQVDCILTLDSDEWVEYCYWEKFRLDAYQKMVVRDKGLWNIYNVDCRDMHQFMGRPRLWFKPWEISYGTTHYEFYRRDDKEKTLINMGGDDYHLIKHMQVSHNPNLRSMEHRFARERWEKAQQKVEDHKRYGDDFSGLKVVKRADEIYIPTKKV